MSQASPVRPARRAAAKKPRVVDSSDEDDAENRPPVNEDDEDDAQDFTPAPKSTKRPARRNNSAESTSTPLPLRSKKSRIKQEEDDTSTIFSPPASALPAAKRAPRKSVRAGRKSVAIELPTENLQEDVKSSPTETTTPTMNKEASQDLETVATPAPLAETTESLLNVRSPVSASPTKPAIKSVMPSQPFEKPMDIVVRTRARGTPQVTEQLEPKARMVITYLILNNFKSYAGRQEVGPFHASFSSVVGPNGSGKSNVIDSLLFVFGFRASKMRQGKISSLIHNSARHPDLDHCEVQVHFQQVLDHPSGAKEIVPDYNLVVSRKAFKNNSSKYYINDRESNFTTVTTMLRDHGIDLDHKRFLILQGEVESIAQMKPKAANEHDDGLLEYLEDIIGTSKYKTPIEESAVETETLNEVCREKNGRVQHVEKEKSSLEGKKNAAVAYINDENELANKQAALWQIFVNECEDNVQVTEEAIGQIQGQLDAEAEKHHGAEDEIKRLTQQHAAEFKQFERMQQNTQAILKQIAKADKEGVKFEEKRNHLSNKIKKLEKTKAASESALSETSSNLKRLHDDLNRNNASVTTLEEDLAAEESTLSSIRESLRGKTESFSSEIEAKQKQLSPWQEQINEKQAAIDVAQSELDMLRERENSGAQAIADLEARMQQLREEKSAKTASVEEIRKEAASIGKESSNLQKKLDKLVAQEPDIRASLSTARQKADEAKASLASSQSRGNVLDGLMRLKDSGRITGFHGRLGNLGTIDQKYDVAISTVCPALDNLVVDTVEVGQQCIDFLRKNNLGRANFILLDRLSLRDLSHLETPEGVPRLFDLVRSKDDKFRSAFYSVMQDTLVAKDLDQANRVAYGAKRWRVVTLDGQLIDKSGTMSGGGTRVAKGAMSSKLVSDTSKEQVTKLETEHEKQEQSFADYQRERQSLEADLKEKLDSMPRLETQIQKAMLEIDSLDRNLKDAEKRATELASASQPAKSDGREKGLEKEIKKLEQDIASLSKNTTGLEQDIKGLQEKIMEVGGVKLRGQKAKVDSLKEQIKHLQEEISAAEVEQTKQTKAKAKHEKASKDSDGEIFTIRQELERFEEDVQKQNKDHSGSRREADEAQETMEAKREEMEAMKADLDQRTAELRETKGVEIEMRNQLEENQKVLNENSKRLTYWQEKLGKLMIQNINEADASLEEQAPATQTRDELSDLDKNVLKGEIAVLEEKTQNTRVETGVLAEYRRRSEEHTARSNDLAEAIGQRDGAKKRCEELRRLRLEGFMESFSVISLRLKEMYQMITMGGNAELELVDSLDPFSEGILFSVMPPKKSWKNISNLSGGEKTLSSLALVFALHHYKPTPLYVMDEIDAALDFRNVSRNLQRGRSDTTPKTMLTVSG